MQPINFAKARKVYIRTVRLATPDLPKLDTSLAQLA